MTETSPLENAIDLAARKLVCTLAAQVPEDFRPPHLLDRDWKLILERAEDLTAGLMPDPQRLRRARSFLEARSYAE